jgi:phytoene synthase
MSARLTELDPDDLDACRRLLASGSRTFHAASFLLPARVRDAATALYAFCRLADDAVDNGDDPAAAHLSLGARLARAYAGDPNPEDRAFATVVRTYAIPIALPAALLEGFRWDAQGRRYETLADVTAYATRVAGTVGAMMALVMGTRDRAVLARACDLGIAMQFSNIARDVGEDARAGRLYLPLEWLAEAGVDVDAFLADPVFSPALGEVVARLLAEADRLYQRAATGIGELPLACRPGMQAARLLYAAIGHEVRRRRFDSVSARARVSPSRKAELLARAIVAGFTPAYSDAAPAVPEASDLVDAAVESAATSAAPQRTVDRVVWVLELFARLEQREAALRAPSAAGALAS